MPRINLLPWREAARQEKTKQFKIAAGGGVAAAVALIVLYHIQIETQISLQESRNQLLTGSITEVNGLLRKKKKLEEREKQILGQIDVIQSLQLSRPLAVHLFDSLARTTPATIYLTGVSQAGTSLKIEGLSSSTQSISEYMRRLDESPRFGSPVLERISSTQQDGERISTFALTVDQNLRAEETAKDKKS